MCESQLRRGGGGGGSKLGVCSTRCCKNKDEDVCHPPHYMAKSGTSPGLLAESFFLFLHIRARTVKGPHHHWLFKGQDGDAMMSPDMCVSVGVTIKCAHLLRWPSARSCCPLKGQRYTSCNHALLFIISRRPSSILSTERSPITLSVTELLRCRAPLLPSQ